MGKIIGTYLLGKNIRRIRKKNKLTQEAVVARMQNLGSSISIHTYSKIENGIRNIKVSDLICLKTVLSADYDDLFLGIPPYESDDYMDTNNKL